MRRSGIYRMGISLTGARLEHTWKCKDGFIVFLVLGGIPGVGTNQALVEWMDEEGIADDFVKSIDWKTFDIVTVTPEDYRRIREPISKLFLNHTKAELYEEAVKRRIMLAPFSTVKDLFSDPQLQSRDFWQEVEHPELDTTITYPKGFIKSTETSCYIRQRAPLIGEHNHQIYEEELGFSREELTILKQNGII